MLRVTIEMIPGGDERQCRTIGSIEISNVSGLAPVSDYVATLYGGDGNEQSRCSVSGHARSRGWQVLLVRVLGAFGYKP